MSCNKSMAGFAVLENDKPVKRLGAGKEEGVWGNLGCPRKDKERKKEKQSQSQRARQAKTKYKANQVIHELATSIKIGLIKFIPPNPDKP